MEILNEKNLTRNNLRPKSQSLQSLNAQALTRTFSLDDMDWTKKVDHSISWMPESMLALTFLSSYRLLNSDQKLAINQKYALAICEQFIWFEQELLCRVIARLMPKLQDQTLKKCLENFANEETRHSELFGKLLNLADPETYKTSHIESRDFNYFKLSLGSKLFFEALIRFPNLFLVWVWLAIFFEEKTIHFSQMYKKCQDNMGHSNVDAQFAKAHALHMIDESRHLQIDQYLLKAFYEPKFFWQKRLCAKLTQLIFRAYKSPRRIAKRILIKLAKEQAEHQLVYKKLINELPTLRKNQAYQEATYSRQVMGRTLGSLELYPEMNCALKELSPSIRN